MWIICIFVVLPMALIGNKLCKKVYIWDKIISAAFFNFPLRTFIEMYLDVVMQVLVNVKFIKFGNYS